MSEVSLYDQYKGQGCVRPTPFDTPTQTRRWKKLALIKAHIHGSKRIGLINKVTSEIRREWIKMQPELIAKATAKQPKPVPSGDIVYYEVMELIGSADPRCVSHKDELLLMVRNRAEMCAKEYGQPLMSEDGRDTQTECLQEGVDLLSYLAKGYMQTKSHRIMVIFNIALILTNEMMDATLFDLDGVVSTD